MWPFPGPNLAIEAKLAARDAALSTAKEFNASEHQAYLNATGMEVEDAAPSSCLS